MLIPLLFIIVMDVVSREVWVECHGSLNLGGTEAKTAEMYGTTLRDKKRLGEVNCVNGGAE